MIYIINKNNKIFQIINKEIINLIMIININIIIYQIMLKIKMDFQMRLVISGLINKIVIMRSFEYLNIQIFSINNNIYIDINFKLLFKF